jgi:hypothetical protein
VELNRVDTLFRFYRDSILKQVRKVITEEKDDFSAWKEAGLPGFFNPSAPPGRPPESTVIYCWGFPVSAHWFLLEKLIYHGTSSTDLHL